MSDLVLASAWLAALVGGVAACVALRAAGVATTYVRDALHVGAGIWVVGWPWWSGRAAPIAVVTAVALATAAVPRVARRSRWVDRFRRSVSSGDERFAGLIVYTASYAALTAVGVSGEPFPAAAGLLALSLGDGVGGAVGRRFGTLHFRAPRGKPKSVEGSVAVFVAATCGVMAAAAIVDVSLSLASAVSLGATAALAEALAPRGTDNAVVPAAVFGAGQLIT